MATTTNDASEARLALSEQRHRWQTARGCGRAQEEGGVTAILATVMFQGQPLPPCVLHEGKPVATASCYTREPGQLVIWHAVAQGVFVRICRSEREA